MPCTVFSALADIPLSAGQLSKSYCVCHSFKITGLLANVCCCCDVGYSSWKFWRVVESVGGVALVGPVVVAAGALLIL